MVLAHGGTAGLALELAVLLVPLACIAILLWWGKRHAGPSPDAPPVEREREEGAP